ncbi:electron transfer flavoprotein, alpha subunit [Citrifermentans bemidjiense Bem]|uniref:Electron transfer flavoprotein, alpha subunit n=1 Tax=Citrifermentans bemidjiense (strain ATCC BAA-1014 / DSM 16622 / JCM 12645 / Bem) TaxID=404380 RepID=B5E7V2_CITBB|nr:electron transfer flavoprotein subunit alpha/FixB family protein [Citrifermentans bemidjiense]ACH38488.1 electron transfer flavoprotein, alpha subunit [Citrifermentans bemidjiense Bem]
MKALLICEQREGKILDTSYELVAFADRLGAEKVLVLVGKEAPKVDAKVYLADVDKFGEYNPDLHKQVVLEAIHKENPDYVVFVHSSYGWDLAPRVAAALKVGQVSEVVNIVDGKFELTLCNAKLRRTVAPKGARAVLTVQAGAFNAVEASGSAQVEAIDVAGSSKLQFVGYEPAEKKDVDLGRAEIIVSAGRGVGKKENVAIIAELAKAFGGELGASRPVVDAGWVAHSHQVGTTGQTVSPKLYVACGISGAIQHLAGMKKSDFIVAINKDKDAPISEAADVMVVADVLQLAPVLMEKLRAA